MEKNYEEDGRTVKISYELGVQKFTIKQDLTYDQSK